MTLTEIISLAVQLIGLNASEYDTATVKQLKTDHNHQLTNVVIETSKVRVTIEKVTVPNPFGFFMQGEIPSWATNSVKPPALLATNINDGSRKLTIHDVEAGDKHEQIKNTPYRMYFFSTQIDGGLWDFKQYMDGSGHVAYDTNVWKCLK